MPRLQKKNRHKIGMRSGVVAALREFYKEYEPIDKSSKTESGFMAHRVLQVHAEYIINAILAKDECYGEPRDPG